MKKPNDYSVGIDLGWDSHVGSILDIDIHGLDGETIKDHWRGKDGVKT